MPEMDGADVIRSIRAIDKRARIIAVSGDATFYSIDYFRLARQIGADAVVRKLDPMERVILEVQVLLRTKT
jgi:CheY-like chemotaxis protein